MSDSLDTQSNASPAPEENTPQSALVPKFTFDRQPDRELGPTILIADDEEGGRKNLIGYCSELREKTSVELLLAASIEEALAHLDKQRVHVLLLDKNFGPKDDRNNGIEAIPKFLELQPHLQILMVTSSEEVQDVARAMKLGAFGYVPKNKLRDLLLEFINSAVRVAKTIMEKNRLELTDPDKEVEFVAESKAAKNILKLVPTIAQSERPILLLGETGTGKTTLAKIIHLYRKVYLKQDQRPFYAIDINAFGKELVERELFGNEPGAFTGADKKFLKRGFFERANGGTLFIDEIGELSPGVQKTLLSVLDTHKFYRLGGSEPIESRFKLICATNRNLEEMVERGEFRHDLFERISNIVLTMPTLSERKDDIPAIVRSLLPYCCKEDRIYTTYEELPQDFIKLLQEYPPRGNIRGIEHQIDRLLVKCPQDEHGRPIFTEWKKYVVYPEDKVKTKRNHNSLSVKDLLNLPVDIDSADSPGLTKIIESIEERILLAAKARFKKNTLVAKFLKLSEGTISLRLKHLNGRVNENTASVTAPSHMAAQTRGVLQ